MAGISITAFASGDAPVIKGHEQPRNGRMTDLHHATDRSGLAYSSRSQSSSTTRSQRSDSASFNENRPCTPQRQTSARPTHLTDSSQPKLVVDTPKAPRARQGSHSTPESTHNYWHDTSSTPDLHTLDLSSPGQESTWSHYAGRLISQVHSPTIYTTPTKTRATRQSSPATSLRSTTQTTPGSLTFSFIASKMAALRAVTSPSTPGAGCGNELIDLDIEAALFPNGVPEEDEAFSPAEYRSLQMNAMGLLHRFQTTYQSQTIEFRTLKAEKEALEDEKSEAETRAHHAKLQLKEVARRAAEKEAAMRAWVEELQRENRSLVQDRQSHMSRPAPSVASTMSEDLGVEEDQAKKSRRRSADTFKTEAGSDTDEDSIADVSIFSRSKSPIMATTIYEISPVEPVPRSRASSSGASVYSLPSQKPPQMTAFRKLMKGISGEAEIRTVAECSNCQGQDASMAWDTASLMRDENRGLKSRVNELESALEGALDIVNGLGI